MKKDKKNFNGNISFVLLEKIGKANFNNLIEQKDLKKILSVISNTCYKISEAIR